MGVAVEIEVGEICDRFICAIRWDFAGAHKTSKALDDLDVHEVWDMPLVRIAKQAGLYPGTKHRLQKEFQQGGCVDDDHADSRSSRMTTAAGVFRVTRLRP